MLRLVVSTDKYIQDFSHKVIETCAYPSFTCSVYSKAPYSYLMAIQDTSHFLDCELVLEVEEHEEKTVICHFPQILDDELNEFIWEDETLLGIILIQFQMNILKQLLSFCSTYDAKMLIIQVDEAQSKGMGIYSNLVAYKDKVPSKVGKFIQMAIPLNANIFDNWVNFMDHTKQDFRRTLWHDQRANPAIRHYLKFHPLG